VKVPAEKGRVPKRALLERGTLAYQGVWVRMKGEKLAKKDVRAGIF